MSKQNVHDTYIHGPNRNPSNFSNTASLLWHAYHSLPSSSPSSQVNWSGFYFTDPKNPSQLILGPFHGQVACQSIAFGRGVCGAAAKTGVTQLVQDVDQFPGHIACDGASKSEIVVPIVKNEKVSRHGKRSHLMRGIGLIGAGCGHH